MELLIIIVGLILLALVGVYFDHTDGYYVLPRCKHGNPIKDLEGQKLWPSCLCRELMKVSD